MNSIALYFHYISISLRAQLEYRASLLLLGLGSFMVSLIEFAGIWVLLERFKTIQGWTFFEIALFYSLINISFAISEGFGRGFDTFHLQVINAEFDRTLLRPRGTLLQVLAHDLQLHRAGRLLQALAILVWAVLNLGIAWTPTKVILLAAALGSGVLVFTGLLVMQAALCFWSTQSLEIVNSFTYGGVETTQWPLNVFKRWFAAVFVFVIPLACVNYFPVLIILDKPDVLGSPRWWQWISPLAGVAFMALAVAVWRTGVRHYHSTGS